MDTIDYLVVGAGISGLSFANWLRQAAAERGADAPEILIIEADDQPGGYCKTVVQDGFVWDYSGHFFHFRHPEIEAWLRARMPDDDIRTVRKRSVIRYAGRDIDFPFQKNIHQLPQDDFIACLVDLYFRDRGDGERSGGDGDSFKRMLYARYGAGIAEKFLIPYNEKLYACDLDQLDRGAMGRFFPHADIADIIGNMRPARAEGQGGDGSYNATFTYPLGGAIRYVHALLRDLPPSSLSYGERLEAIDLRAQVARTSRRAIRYRRLVSSAPLTHLATMCGVPSEPGVLTWNKVLVFNLGFDRKGDPRPHWMYFPDRALSFYRVGWYDNIMDSARMSLYVELGMAADAVVDVEAARERVMGDLRRAGIVGEHRLVSWHSVILDPAYVHITGRSQAEVARLRAVLGAAGVYPVGRYGGWTYCSIEDNMVETRQLAAVFAPSL